MNMMGFCGVMCLLLVMVAGTVAAENYTYLSQWGSYGSEHSQFVWPRGIALDKAGNVYVADMGNDRVQIFGSDGTFLGSWGSTGTADGRFQYPMNIAIDGSGDIYVTDCDNNRVQKFYPNGTFKGKWGSYGDTDGKFSCPRGIVTDGSAYVYVADYGNNRVQRFDSTGMFLTKWGSFGSSDGQFQQPNDLAKDGSGNIYVVDTGNFRIQKFNATGTLLGKWGSPGTADGQFSYPTGITVDSTGNVFVSDGNNHRVQKFNRTGGFLTTWGSAGSENGQFSNPWGIAASPTGNVYVADSSNHRIQKFQRVVPSVTVTVPNGGQNWQRGTAQIIRWSYTGTIGPAVRIDLMKNMTRYRVINASVPAGSSGAGSYRWVIPFNQTPGTDYRVRVIGSLGYSDMSNANFTISAGPLLTLTTPAGRQNWTRGSTQVIRWSYTGNPGTLVRIDLLKGGVLNRVINAGAPAGTGGSGSYAWKIVHDQLPGTDYRIKVTSTTSALHTNRSRWNFTIAAGAPIMVTVPNGKENWTKGSLHAIRWSYTGKTGPFVKIELMKAGVVNKILAANTTIGSNGSGSRLWAIPAGQVPGSDYRVRITSLKNAAHTDQSNATFTISAA